MIGYASSASSKPSRLPWTKRLAARLVVIGDDTVELLPHTPYEVRYTPDTAVMGFAFETQAGTHAFASDRQTAFRTRPNSLAYIPAG